MAKQKGSTANGASLSLTEERLNKIADEICYSIDCWEQDFRPMRERIRENERLYYNSQESVTQVENDEISTHIPIVKPRLGQRRASVIQTIFKEAPWFTINAMNQSEEAKKVEGAIQFFLENASFKTHFDKACKIAYRSQAAFMRVSYLHSESGLPESDTTGVYSGPIFDVIHPTDMAIYPYNVTPELAMFHGHRFFVIHSDIIAKMDSGDWIKHDKFLPADDEIPDSRQSNTDRKSHNEVFEAKHSPQELWDGLYRTHDLGGDSRAHIFRVIIHRTNRKVLYIRPYDVPLSWYVPIAIESDAGKVIPDDSPSQDLQGIQKLIDRLFSAILTGAEMTASPPVLTANNNLGPRVKRLRPGEMIPVDRVETAKPLEMHFAMGGYGEIMGLLRQFADSAGRVSDTLTGSPSSERDSTATENNIKLQAFQVAGNDDIASLTPSMTRMAKLVYHYLGQFFVYWQKVYDHLGIKEQDRSVFDSNITIKLAAIAVSESPSVQLQFAQQMLQIMSAIPELQALKPQMLATLIRNSPLQDKQNLLDQLEMIADSQRVVTPAELVNMGASPMEASMIAMQHLQAQMGGGQPMEQNGNESNTENNLEPGAILAGLLAAQTLEGGPLGIEP